MYPVGEADRDNSIVAVPAITRTPLRESLRQVLSLTEDVFRSAAARAEDQERRKLEAKADLAWNAYCDTGNAATEAEALAVFFDGMCRLIGVLPADAPGPVAARRPS